jgi:hypothetical protein
LVGFLLVSFRFHDHRTQRGSGSSLIIVPQPIAAGASRRCRSSGRQPERYLPRWGISRRKAPRQPRE